MMRYSAPSNGLGRLGSVVMVQEGQGGVMVETGLGNVELADTLLSPGAVRAAMDDVNDHVTHLMTDITADQASVQSSAAGQRFFADWMTFFAQWNAWYATRVQSTSWLTGPFTVTGAAEYSDGQLVSALRLRAATYNDFESRYRTITGHVPSFNPSPSSDNSWLGLPVAAWVGIGAGVVALGFVAWTANSVSRFAPATRALRGRRRR